MKVKADQEVLDQMEGKGSTAPNEETAVATRQPGSVGQILGDVSDGESLRAKLPMLQLVHGTSGGKLKEMKPGSFALDGEYLLVGPGEGLVITFVNSVIYWKEYVDQEKRKQLRAENRFAKTWPTEEAANKDNQVTRWPAKGTVGPKPTAAKASCHELLVCKPDGVECAMFGFELGGKLWAPARLFLDKGAHTDVVSELMKNISFALSTRKPEFRLVAGKYELRSALKTPKGGGDAYQAPKLRLVGGHTDEECAKIVEAFGGTVPEIPADAE